MTTSPLPPTLPATRPWLMAAVVVAAAFELVALRLLTRTAIHIPGISKVEGPYRVVAEAGRYAYFVAVVLLVVALGSVVWRGLKAGAFNGHLFAIGWFLAAAGAARLDLISDATLAWSVIGSVLVLVHAAMRRYRSRMLPILLFGMSFAVAGLHAGTQSAGFGIMIGPAPDGLLPLAETLAVLACVTSPMLVRTDLRKGPLLTGISVAVATLVAFVASPATVKILLLWNFGLAGYFPAIAYSVAFGTLAFTVMSGRSADMQLALGLALLVLGGLSLSSSYQSGLVLLGLVTLGTIDHPVRHFAISRTQVPGARIGVSFESVSAG